MQCGRRKAVSGRERMSTQDLHAVQDYGEGRHNCAGCARKPEIKALGFRTKHSMSSKMKVPRVQAFSAQSSRHSGQAESEQRAWTM